MQQNFNEGFIEVITGCMFSGKTEELIRRISVLTYAHKRIIAFKPALDDRYSTTSITSHSGDKVVCYVIEKAEEIYKHINEDTEVVAIDEVQFFDEKIVDICEDLADKGIRVMVSGLDLDFRGEPFYNTMQLITRAEFVSKLTAICAICGAPATRSQRIIDGEIADYNDSIVKIGAVEIYEPRCRHCHEIKGK